MSVPQRLRLALLVFSISLMLRAVWAAWAQVTPVSDFRGYDSLAVRWLETGLFGGPGRFAYRTPGYPAFLALIYMGFGHTWQAVAFVQAALGALTSGLTALLATYVVSARGSILAGLLHALSPTALAYVPVLASENLAVTLVVAGVLLLVVSQRASDRGRYGVAFGVGMVLGLLVLVRPAGLFFAPGWLIVMACSPQRRRLYAGPPVVAILAAALALCPWLVRNQRVGLSATTLSTAGGVNAWMGNNDAAVAGGYRRAVQAEVNTNGMGELQKDRAYREAALTWIRGHPLRYFALSGTRLVRLLGAEPDGWAAAYLLPSQTNDRAFVKAYWPAKQGAPEPDRVAQHAGDVLRRSKLLLMGVRALLAPLILLSAALCLFRWRTHFAVMVPAASYLGGLALIYVQVRFRELVDPLLFIPLAGLLSDLLFGTEELGRRLSRRQKGALSALVVIASLALHGTGLASGMYRLEPPH
jgi:4-amino-4-deoxy-L-arabinose transferase-like glycosyltransferase